MGVDVGTDGGYEVADRGEATAVDRMRDDREERSTGFEPAGRAGCGRRRLPGQSVLLRALREAGCSRAVVGQHSAEWDVDFLAAIVRPAAVGNVEDRSDAELAELLDEHPDAEILRSIPGLGTKLAARLVGEFGDAPNRSTMRAVPRCTPPHRCHRRQSIHHSH